MQTVIAGVLALAAGFFTVVATMIIARRQIAAAREDADRVIAATREQTEVAAKQTETTVRLQQTRDASEARAFHVMLEAAMARVLAEAAWARKTYLGAFTQSKNASVDALLARQCITKGAFAELRAACVRKGSPLTGDFLDLEREIDSFAANVRDQLASEQRGVILRMGAHAGLGEQLTLIETKADALRNKPMRQGRKQDLRERVEACIVPLKGGAQMRGHGRRRRRAHGLAPRRCRARCSARS